MFPRTALLPAIALWACAGEVSMQDCDRLLDHYVQLLVRAEAPETTAADIVEKQAAARLEARRNPAYQFPECTARVSPRQLRCALDAKTVDEVERCLIP